jgi:hypothetical protein
MSLTDVVLVTGPEGRSEAVQAALAAHPDLRIHELMEENAALQPAMFRQQRCHRV